jgi:hypothetical protein
MPELRSKSPRENYATRSAQPKPNIAYPDGAVPAGGEEARAAVELADDQVAGAATTTGGAALRATVTTAVQAVVTEDAAAATAITNSLTDAAIKAAVTVAPSVDFADER